jgi:hypothetical protein
MIREFPCSSCGKPAWTDQGLQMQKFKGELANNGRMIRFAVFLDYLNGTASTQPFCKECLLELIQKSEPVKE